MAQHEHGRLERQVVNSRQITSRFLLMLQLTAWDVSRCSATRCRLPLVVPCCAAPRTHPQRQQHHPAAAPAPGQGTSSRLAAPRHMPPHAAPAVAAAGRRDPDHTAAAAAVERQKDSGLSPPLLLLVLVRLTLRPPAPPHELLGCSVGAPRQEVPGKAATRAPATPWASTGAHRPRLAHSPAAAAAGCCSRLLLLGVVAFQLCPLPRLV